jgi:hypothetical protein
MKRIISFAWVNALIGIALSSALFAFSFPMGAHSVQVFLDNKLVIDQYVKHSGVAPTVALDPAEKHDQLIVKYNECGRTVTGRKITLKDSEDKVLKDWRFEGSSTGFANSMQCPVKDIIALQRKGSNTLKLYYSSKEFPEGQQIANLVIGKGMSTAAK